MSDVTKSTLKIDGKFWKIRTRTNGPKVNHLVWTDEIRPGMGESVATVLNPDGGSCHA